MLISNFMRTTLHGVESLYPDFSPYVAKYGDNGGAKSKAELETYFGRYRLRDPVARLVKGLSTASEQVIRKALPEDTAMFRAAKRIYHHLSRRG